MGTSKAELQCDVAVVGAGYAGLAAALEALKAGADVIVLGRPNPFASNSALGGGVFALVDTPLQRHKGVHDSADLLTKDLLEANRRTIPQDIVAAAAQQSRQLYEWMTGLGARFYDVIRFPGHSVARVHLESGMGGANFLRLLLEAVTRAHADLRLGTAAEHLILTGSNEVEGVQVADAEGRTFIKTKLAVVLAAGGFGKNHSMMTEYLPKFAEMICVSGAGSTGDGIRMGIEVGAELMHMDTAELYSLGSVKKGFRIPGVSEALTLGAILLLGFSALLFFSLGWLIAPAALLLLGLSLWRLLRRQTERRT
jgi:succinate dehydrogenase/fumarate reductase flavoprotein subunit